MIIEELNRLNKNLLKVGSTALEWLNPPIHSSQLANFLREEFGNIDISNDLFALYGWHNGTNTEELKSKNMNFGISYISELIAINNIDDVLSHLKADTVFNLREDKLFPFAQSYQGELYGLSLIDDKVYYCSTSDIEVDNVVSIFSSLESMLFTINQWYDSNCLVLNEDNVIELDLDLYEEYHEIGQKNNQNADYWKIKLEDLN